MARDVRPFLLAAALGSIVLAAAAIVVLLTRPAGDIGRPIAPALDALGADLERTREAVAALDARVAGLEARLEAVAAELRAAPSPPEAADEAPLSGRAGPVTVPARGLEAATDWLRRLLPDRFAGLTPEEALFLRELDLRGVEIMDADLEHLESLPSLRHLALRGTAVTDEGLVHLAGLEQLQHLELRGTKVAGSGFGHLPSGLETLDLTDTGVTEDALHRLPALPSLRALDLNRLALGDSACDALGRFPGLRHVELDGTGISDDGLRRLLDLNPAIERVEIRDTRTTDSAAGELAAAHPGLTIVRESPPFFPR
jgi:hypothetical protein